MSVASSPVELGPAHHQPILNEHWPAHPRLVPDRPPIPVRARIVWRDDGEEWVNTMATRWTRDSVFVHLDHRFGPIGTWIPPTDVRRR